MRVLIVEDEWLLAEELSDLLRARGCEIVGPAPSVEAALRLIRSEAFDVAVIDANLRGRLATPVAQALRERAIGFMLLTAYAAADLASSPLAGIPRAPKPLRADAVCRTLEEVVAR